MKKGKQILAVLLAIACAGLLGISTLPRVTAATESTQLEETTASVPQAGKTVSLNIQVLYTDVDKNGGQTEKPVDGVQLTATCLAGMQIGSGSVSFSLLQPFRSAGLDTDFKDMTASEQMEVVQRAAKLLDSEPDQFRSVWSQTATTDANGELTFDQINNSGYGIYLIRQTGKSGSAAKYNTLAPYLAMLPEYDSVDASWIYEVSSFPKSELRGSGHHFTPPGDTSGTSETSSTSITGTTVPHYTPPGDTSDTSTTSSTKPDTPGGGSTTGRTTPNRTPNTPGGNTPGGNTPGGSRTTTTTPGGSVIDRINHAVKTGDYSQIMPLVAAAAGAVVILAVLIVMKRRNNRSEG